MTVAIEGGEETLWIDALNSLAEMTKPRYKPSKGFNGVFCKMQIGNFINETGLLQNVDISVDNESPWKNDVPLYINCSVSLRVTGDKKPDYKASGGNLGSKSFGTGKAK